VNVDYCGAQCIRYPAVSSRVTVSSGSPVRSSRHTISRRASAKGTESGLRLDRAPLDSDPAPAEPATGAQPEWVPARRVLLERGVEHDQCRAVRVDWAVQRHHEVLRLVDNHQPSRSQH